MRAGTKPGDVAAGFHAWRCRRVAVGRQGRLPPRGGRGRAAFTLLEVLAALAVFAFCAVVLASAYLNILNSYDIVSRHAATDDDVAFARHLVLMEADREKLEEGGEFESVGGRRVRWAVEIVPTLMPDLYTTTFTCEISDPAKTEAEKTTQTFTLLRPTWTIDTAERDKLREDVKTRILELKSELDQNMPAASR